VRAHRMINHLRQLNPPGRLLGLVTLVVLALSLPANANPKKTGKHLFILSGQSNMTGTVRDAFADRVQERFGEENAVVVMRMKSGRGIRFWVADYRQPGDHGPSDKRMNSNGQEYKPLIEAVMAAGKDQSFDTVGFIWMQGESDANNRLSEVYEESFVKLIKQLKKDLSRDDLYFVVGRINDYGRGGPQHEHWQRVRDAQAKLGNTSGNAWLDTDDLNGGDANKPNGDIHFPKQGAVILGQRFADKAMELIGKQ
jgi:hypothetical protein